MLLVIGISIAWLVLAIRDGRLAVWLLLLWIPIQGRVQLNIFLDSSATVLIDEFLIIGIYVAFGIRAVRSPAPRPAAAGEVRRPLHRMDTPPGPDGHRNERPAPHAGRLVLDVLPLPLIWIGYRAFETRRELENLSLAADGGARPHRTGRRGVTPRCRARSAGRCSRFRSGSVRRASSGPPARSRRQAITACTSCSGFAGDGAA